MKEPESGPENTSARVCFDQDAGQSHDCSTDSAGQVAECEPVTDEGDAAEADATEHEPESRLPDYGLFDQASMHEDEAKEARGSTRLGKKWAELA
jgi:hypothetical protein